MTETERRDLEALVEEYKHLPNAGGAGTAAVDGVAFYRAVRSLLARSHEEPASPRADLVAALRADREALRSRLAVLTVALTQVLPEKMGGTPDLFSPEGGWDKWEEKARSALGDVGDVRERVARMLLGISDFYVEWDSRPEDEKQRWRADADCLLAAIAMLPKEVR